jgi:hypothetical protein
MNNITSEDVREAIKEIQAKHKNLSKVQLILKLKHEIKETTKLNAEFKYCEMCDSIMFKPDGEKVFFCSNCVLASN